MSVLGSYVHGASAQDAVADTRYHTVAGPASADDRYLAKVTAYLDGGGSGSGDQVFRALAYAGSGTTAPLVATSAAVTVFDGQAAAWVDFYFDSPTAIAGGTDLTVGLQAGAPDSAARLHYSTGGGGRLTQADTYADGPEATVGSLSSAAGVYSIFATLFEPWEVPELDDANLARLPFPEAQTVLVGAGSDPIIATCGWHGTIVDIERGAFLIVDPDGPLADLVGERVKVSARRKSVYVYCHSQNANILDDASLTRRAFMELATLATNQLDPATFEVVSG